MEKSLLLETYLKQLRLPAVGRHYQEVARQAVQGNFSYEAFLLARVELEAQQRRKPPIKRNRGWPSSRWSRPWTISTSNACPLSTMPRS